MANDTERTPAEEMRAAANRLREAAKGTTPPDWMGVGSTNEDAQALIFGGPLDEAGYRTGVVFWIRDGMDCEECQRPSPEDVLWMQTVHPGLADPLATWLETEAYLWESRGNTHEGHTFDALKTARVINGGEPGA